MDCQNQARSSRTPRAREFPTTQSSQTFSGSRRSYKFLQRRAAFVGKNRRGNRHILKLFFVFNNRIVHNDCSAVDPKFSGTRCETLYVELVRHEIEPLAPE